MKRVAAYKPTGSAVSRLHRTRGGPALWLSLIVLFYFACVGVEPRLMTPRAPTTSGLHPSLQVLPQSVSIPLFNGAHKQPLSRHMQGGRQCLFSGQRPCYVLLNSQTEALNPSSLLTPPEEAVGESQHATRKAAEPVRVFSFWQRPRAAPVFPENIGAAEPVPRGPAVNAAGIADTPVILHFPAVAEGWMQQTDEDVAEKAALAGAAMVCGDLVLLPLPLEALNGPASLLPLHQPLPLLLSALQLQLQVRSMQRQETQGLPTALAAAANRTKPIVVLLRDPVLVWQGSPGDKSAGGDEVTEAEDGLRLAAAHAALRLLEGEWRAIASELGVVTSGEPPQPEQQQQQQTPAQQLQQPNPLVPNFRELFSVHIVFVRGLPRVPGLERQASSRPASPAYTAALQRLLQSLLKQHRAREANDTSQSGPAEQHQQKQQQQQLAAGSDSAGGGNMLQLFDAAAAACRILIAAPESTQQPQPADIAGEAPPDGPLTELSFADAVAFDAEVYRRRALAKCVRWGPHRRAP